MTCAVFLFNTSEFVPVGLLSDLSTEFSLSESQTGIIITLYAWIVLLCSLPLILLFSRCNFKYLLAGLLFIFCLSQTLTALAPNFYVLTAARCFVALTHSLFWSIATPLAVKITPKGQISRALGLVAGGTAVAMVAGLPLGRIIGLHLGWRFTFALLGLFAFINMLAVLRLCPGVPGTRSTVLTVLPRILHNKNLLSLYIVTALLFTAHFTPYSYIEPLLGAAGISPEIITSALVSFGIAGIMCSLLFARCFETHQSCFIAWPFAGICLFLLALELSSYQPILTLANCMSWGFCFSCCSLTFQALVLKFEPEYPAIATAIYSSICNLGIGAGAFIGARLLENAPLSGLIFCGAGLSMVCFALIRIFFLKRWMS